MLRRSYDKKKPEYFLKNQCFLNGMMYIVGLFHAFVAFLYLGEGRKTWAGHQSGVPIFSIGRK
jgi:hypothetical protein